MNTVHNKKNACWNRCGVHSMMVFIVLLSLAEMFLECFKIHSPMVTGFAWAESQDPRELQLKAAFLYNFMKFIDWPAEKLISEKSRPVMIVILGEHNFKELLDVIKDKKIKNNDIQVVSIEGFSSFKKSSGNATMETYLQENKKQIESGHLLYICDSEKDNCQEILKAIGNMPIVSVSSVPAFCTMGGIIEFITEDNKVRFDINQDSAEKKKIKINSQLLQLARDVIKKDAA